jgi:hypothetical protein
VTIAPNTPGVQAVEFVLVLVEPFVFVPVEPFVFVPVPLPVQMLDDVTAQLPLLASQQTSLLQVRPVEHPPSVSQWHPWYPVTQPTGTPVLPLLPPP